MADVRRMEIQYLGDQRYVGRNEAGYRILIDGSEDTTVGVRPMEALLAKHRTPVAGYRIELEGERAKEHPRRYTTIRVRHLVGGEGITQENLERAVNLSHEKYCSVAATLNAGVESEAVLER